MKKMLSIILGIAILLSMLYFSACRKQTDKFFSGDALKDCQISDLPKPVSATDLYAPSTSSLYFNTTPEGFEKNAEQIYEYLISKNFKYFGYRGAELSSFFGGAPEYEFFTSTQQSDHRYLVDRNGNPYENCYVFVWANELSESNGLLSEGVIELIYDSSDEEYNTHLIIRYNKNVLTSYTLKEKSES